jgi:sec-independent protein translocase protein TatB
MDNIFGIGGPELLLILVLATVVLGPLRMIQVARGFGRLVRDLRNYSQELMGGLNQELAFLDEAQAVIREGVNAASLKPEEVQSVSPNSEPNASTGPSEEANPGQINVSLADQIPLSAAHEQEGDVSAEPIPENAIQTSADSVALAPPSTSDRHALGATVEPGPANHDPT